MKTRTDKTIPIIIILYGLFFTIPVLIVPNFKPTTFSILWTSLCALIVLLGLWKIESFEITDNRLTKRNFFGLFQRTVNLEKLIRYDKKVIDTDHFKNPINIVKWFSNDKRYLVFRKVTILTEGNGRITLDERTINKEDFNALYSKIKECKSNQSRY